MHREREGVHERDTHSDTMNTKEKKNEHEREKERQLDLPGSRLDKNGWTDDAGRRWYRFAVDAKSFSMASKEDRLLFNPPTC